MAKASRVVREVVPALAQVASMERLGRSRRLVLTGLALALLLLLAAGATVAFAVTNPASQEPQPVAALRAAPDAAAVRAFADTNSVEPAREAALPDETTPAATVVCTFLDGVPVPSLVRDVRLSPPTDWNEATPRHALPVAGDRFAVVARDCQIVLLDRSELPPRGERCIDMTRAPVLDVRLVNVPRGLRDRLRLLLQLDYGQLERGEN